MDWHLNEFFKDVKVASLAATRLPNVERILSQIDFKNLKTFVELGPGDGAFTSEILKHLAEDAVLLLIESNPNFVEILKQKFRDPRIKIIQGCATDILSILHKNEIRDSDCILCGIPLTFLTASKAEKLIEDCSRSLDPSGKLILYQALNPIHKANMTKVLQGRFKDIKDEIFTINLPPLFVLYAGRKIHRHKTSDTFMTIGSPFEKPDGQGLRIL